MNKDITIRVNGKNNPSVSTKNLKELTAKVDSLEQDLVLANKKLDENWANPMSASWGIPSNMGHVRLEPNVNGFVEHDNQFEGFVDIQENELEEYYDIDYWNDTEYYFHFNRTTNKFVLYGKDKTDNQFKFYKDWYWYDSEETGIRTHGGHWVEAEHINWIPDEYINIEPSHSYSCWNATTRQHDTYNWDVALGDFVPVKNILTQEMMVYNKTIYHIQYDFDLDGKTIIVPENCILEFEGGSLRNGTLVGNNTKITGIANITATKNGAWSDIYDDVNNLNSEVAAINNTLKISGSTRPTENLYKGYKFFDTTINKPIYWDDTKWVDEKGYTALPSTSTLDTLRTTHAESGTDDEGMIVFLTDVKKPVYLAEYYNIASIYYHRWAYMDGTIALDESVAPVNS